MMPVNEFLQKLYDEKSEDKQVDLVLKTCFNFDLNFLYITEILQQVDLTKITISAMISFLSCTFKYDKQIEYYSTFYDRVKQELKNRGETKDRIKGLLRGFENSNNFWSNMEAYGAPEWLSGKKP